MAADFSELKLEGVTRNFGKSAALTDLSLTVKRGEFVALLGPSGGGKSTALNCLAGLLPLSAGTISLDDRRVDHLAPEQRGFGMVFQNYALFPHLTVRGNVAFGLQMRRISKPEIERQVTAALALVQLSAHADKHPGQLSGGQQQRVAIARAVVVEPPIVLMDEPLSNLDAKLRHEMRGEMRRLHQELGLTTIYVTHDQEEALSLADRLVVLSEGRVQQIGTPEEIYLRPVNSFVADFVGYRNLLPMTIDGVDPTTGQLTMSGAGVQLRADPRVNGPLTGPVTVAMRPDDLVVGQIDGNQIDATVESVEYQGRDFEMQVRTQADIRLFLRTTQRLSIGEPVAIGIGPDRLVVYPADAASTVGASAQPLREREAV
ncbi:ABC transporter ATP-binding protein [Cryobacterium sp. TMS1-20-1]|nr:ABC transporter ATP-binding protein [Cryobacterium sp. TMS1-20-1]